MRFLVWNTETKQYDCSECSWKQALSAASNDPAERLELEFQSHRCEDFQRKAA